MALLKFSKQNAKIRFLKDSRSIQPYLEGGKRIYSLDLFSGWTCPFAHKCLSKVIVTEDGKKVKDGKHTEFRCFSASQESLFPALYNLRKHNTQLLTESTDIEGLIFDSMPDNAGVIRIHVGGDFFNQGYFDAWLNMARFYVKKLFYAYTKSLPYWIAQRNNIPKNLVLTASYGGRYDNLIKEEKLRSSTVVYSTYQARKLGLQIDYTDEKAANPDPEKRNKDFALLIHGIQPAGTIYAKAWQRIKSKQGGYHR